MPEGPEMYRMARKIARAVGNKPLTEVWFAFDSLKPWSTALTGLSVDSVETRGKALLLCFANGVTIYTHNQLYGRWMFSSPDQRPDTRRQLRLALSTAERSALLYSASEIAVLPPGALDSHPFIARIGLDILSADGDWRQVAEWITQPRFARRQLGHLLLDQSFLAGVGNYLRSEILFYAGLMPHNRICDLNPQALDTLADAACEMMWRSARSAGITNDLERVERLKVAGWKRSEYRHYVFGRQAQACFDCDSPIEKQTNSGRRLYFCPVCQR
ncbi:MAG: endonuclease VIII [Pseudomonadota bacterium]